MKRRPPSADGGGAKPALTGVAATDAALWQVADVLAEIARNDTAPPHSNAVVKDRPQRADSRTEGDDKRARSN